MLTLADCVKSVRSQNYGAEHVVIDGQSKDGTLELLQSSGIDKVLSEPDKGIYDAINKGIALSSGDIIGLLHSDDLYADEFVLKRVAELFADPTIDSCYGDLLYVDRRNTERIRRYWKSGPFRLDRFYWGWMPPHPTFFVRRAVYERYGAFNLSLDSAADYELMLRFLLKHRVTTAYIPSVLIKMRSGGTSNATLRNRLKANRMDRKAWVINGLKPYPWTTYLKPLLKIGQFVAIPAKPQEEIAKTGHQRTNFESP